MGGKRVAIVATSANTFKLKDGTCKPTGCWYEELAGAFQVLTAAGHQVEIFSVGGGGIPFDAGSMADQFFTEHCKAFSTSENALKAMNTKSVKEAKDEILGFDALYLPGGHGTYGDYHNADLADVISGFYNAGKPVSIVCHGPLALCNPALKKADGTPLVAGHEVTCFSDVEETQVGLMETVPYSCEQKLQELGGVYKSGDAWGPFVVVSENLLTGQNPGSSVSLAEALLKKL